MVDQFAGFQRADLRGVPVLWKEDARFKTFRVTLHSQRPLDDAAAARSLLPGLLLLGTTRDPDRPSLARRMENLYGASVLPGTTRVGETHAIRFSLDSVSGKFLPGSPDQLGDGLNFLVDYLARPKLDGDGFPERAFERERTQAEAAVRALIDDKGSYAQERALELACAGEPMAIPEHGGLERIAALDRVAPERTRQDFLTHGRMWLIAMGALDGDALLGAVDEFLGALPERSEQPLAEPVLVEPRPPRRQIERTELQQSKMVLIFRTPRTDARDTWIARRLFVSLLGGGPHSRLFREVREKQSLAYYASAAVEHHKGLMFVQIGLDEAAAERAEAETLRQLAELQAGNFSEDELNIARAGIVSSLQSIDDSISQRCGFTSERWLTGVDRTPAQQAQRYLDATKDEVVAAGQGIWLDYSYLLASNGGAS